MSALEKLLKGEVLTEEERNSLSPEEIAEAKRKELEALEAIRAEKRRNEERRDAAGEEFSKRFLAEQTKKAEEFVFNDLVGQGIELTEEKKSKIRDLRAKLDSGAVTYDNLVEDFFAASAAIERKTLFEDRKKRTEFEKNAAEFIKQSAGASGGGAQGGAEGDKKYPQEVWDMVNEAKARGFVLTPDEALRSLTEGLRRVHK